MFKVILKSDEMLMLNNECTQVDYSDKDVMVFKQYISEKEYKVLAIIPKENIKYVKNY